jgi:hypothetical protein
MVHGETQALEEDIKTAAAVTAPTQRHEKQGAEATSLGDRRHRSHM